jgi:hypothetical protein
MQFLISSRRIQPICFHVLNQGCGHPLALNVREDLGCPESFARSSAYVVALDETYKSLAVNESQDLASGRYLPTAMLSFMPYDALLELKGCSLGLSVFP